MAEAVVATRQPWYTVLYIQVLIAIVIGILLGHFWPALATQMKPLGDGFIALILTFYATSILCVLVVIGTIAHLAGFSILRFIAYIKDGLLIVLGTSSSETVAAPHDPEDGAPRRLEVRGRPGDPDRLQLQLGRHEYLYDARDIVPGAGHQHAAHPWPETHVAGGRDADLQGAPRGSPARAS